MGHKVKQSLMSSRIDFFYYAFRNVLLVSVPLLILSSVVLSHLSFHSSAIGSNDSLSSTSSSNGGNSSSGSDNLTITISSACTLSSVVDSEHNAGINAGTYKDNIGKTTIKTTCNDNNGYSIYANGYTNNEEGNNRLINTLSSSNVIETGLNTSGDNSAWAMKLNNIEDDPSPTPPVIESAYDDTYGIVPSNWTKVLSLSSGTTDMSLGSSFTTTYAVYANSRQYTGTYQGQVKYILTHPNSNSQHLFMQDIAQLKDKILLNEGDSTQLIDQRDGKSYWVTKLADGNIWMTQNLDFDIYANTTLNSQTTDLNVAYDASTSSYREYRDGYTDNGDIIYWQPVSSATTIDFTGTNVSDWQDSNTTPYTANKTDSTETGHNSLGNYYNWTAAIASNNSSSLTQDTSSDISKNPKNSICPKGWRLPTISNESETLAGSSNEFARLNYLYNNNKTTTDAGIITSPLYFNNSGIVLNGLLAMGEGVYWSSTNNSSGSAYFFAHKPNQVKPKDNWHRYIGISIRCVTRE